MPTWHAPPPRSDAPANPGHAPNTAPAKTGTSPRIRTSNAAASPSTTKTTPPRSRPTRNAHADRTREAAAGVARSAVLGSVDRPVSPSLDLAPCRRLPRRQTGRTGHRPRRHPRPRVPRLAIAEQRRRDQLVSDIVAIPHGHMNDPALADMDLGTTTEPHTPSIARPTTDRNAQPTTGRRCGPQCYGRTYGRTNERPPSATCT